MTERFEVWASGPKIRGVVVHKTNDPTCVTLQFQTGNSSNSGETVESFAKKYGTREALRVLGTRDRFLYDLPLDVANKKLQAWKNKNGQNGFHPIIVGGRNT